MALKDRVFGDFGIGQKAVGCFRVGPILAGQRKAAADGTGHVGQELAQALAKTAVPEATAGEFLVDPGDGIGSLSRRAHREGRLCHGPAPAQPCHGG
jgi:hypothetical protein